MKNHLYRMLVPASALVLIFSLLIGLGLDHAVTVWAENRPIERERCYVIDAGHGGIDGGATSCTGVLESHLNLEIALRLNELMHFLGYETLMIRSDDRSVYTKGETIAAQKVSDLKHRVEIIENTPNPVLISIHQNHFADSRYSGAQIFYAPSEESKLIASDLQTAFRQTINPGSKRQSKKADNIYLLEHISCPGILIECGFLSNPQEEYKLRSADYQKQICIVIATKVTGFYSQS